MVLDWGECEGSSAAAKELEERRSRRLPLP